jgi:predicted CoA-binding protein
MHTNYCIACYLVPVNDLKKHTLVLGASNNPERYSYLAILFLRAADIPVSALGLRPANIEDVTVHTEWDQLRKDPIDTITLYLGAERQKEHYNNILAVKPRRIIFNPGTENAELEQLAEERGIETLRACTLVMLRANLY